MDRNCKVSAKIQRNRELGIVAWDGGAQLELLYIAKTIKVLKGDVIVTSGYSQIYPEYKFLFAPCYLHDEQEK